LAASDFATAWEKMSHSFIKEEIQDRLVSLYSDYLEPRGWGNPREEGATDVNHAPLPFITYPSRTMLHQIVQPTFRVFEYGCGQWWASLVEEVVSVDHDEEWIKRIQEKGRATFNSS
jgi:hypothetical protein